MNSDPYRFTAWLYDKLFEPINRGLRLMGLRMFSPTEGMTVLDVGCGTGVHLRHYQRYGCHTYGIDPSPSMMGIARKRLGEGANLHLGDASSMPYKEGSFDLAIAMFVLHEMDQSIRHLVIDEMKRVLKDNGRILLIDFHSGPILHVKGWFTKIIILLSEVAAGRRHYRNYRKFMAIKGVPALAKEHGLNIEAQRVVSGGTLGLYILSRGRD